MGKKKKVDPKEEVKVARRRRRTERQDEFGRELGDSTPMAPPVGYKREPTIAERIRTMVRGEALRQAAEQAGMESFEEADDFDVPDDDSYDPQTPYEEIFDPPPTVPATRGEGGRGAAGPPSGAPSRSAEDDGGGVQPPAADTTKDGARTQKSANSTPVKE